MNKLLKKQNKEPLETILTAHSSLLIGSNLYLPRV